ncbi:MAG: DUF2975 domain-containing protein [Erythrobacter sp.]|uniref:DUF2975 domain-containing protein n=1 Tax=Erythrobacter sp. TaxID=1042 RepID=UPI0032EF7D37
MKDKPNDLLLLAGTVLTYIAQIGLALGGLAIAIAAPLMLIFNEKVSVEFAQKVGEVSGSMFIAITLGLMIVAFGIIAAAFAFFGKLRAIIASVGEGDPFAPENADRLNLMAWLLLGMQLLMIPAMGIGLMLAKWADEVENAEITIDAGLDIEGILMVIVLFILARVFKHGAAMREDLEGTV